MFMTKKNPPLSIWCYVLIHLDLKSRRLSSFRFYLGSKCKKVRHNYLSKRQEHRFPGNISSGTNIHVEPVSINDEEDKKGRTWLQ